MKFVPAKCPLCNGDLQIPDDRDFVKCMYCGGDIKVREVIMVESRKIDEEIPYLLMQGSKSFDKEEYEKAEDIYDKIIYINPNLEEALEKKIKISFILNIRGEIFDDVYCFFNDINEKSENIFLKTYNNLIDKFSKETNIKSKILMFMDESLSEHIKYFEEKLEIYREREEEIETSENKFDLLEQSFVNQRMFNNTVFYSGKILLKKIKFLLHRLNYAELLPKLIRLYELFVVGLPYKNLDKGFFKDKYNYRYIRFTLNNEEQRKIMNEFDKLIKHEYQYYNDLFRKV